MFTGIVTHVGRIECVIPQKEGARLQLSVPPAITDGMQVGESLAVQGVCLTVIKVHPGAVEMDVSAHTLSCTCGLSQTGMVNLERALQLSDRLSGHFVTGHVDGVAAVTQVTAIGDSHEIHLDIPAALARYVARKGSLCVDGVSLTINEVKGNSCALNLIAHTWQNTTLNRLTFGTQVNVEVDLIARYLDQMLSTSHSAHR